MTCISDTPPSRIKLHLPGVKVTHGVWLELFFFKKSTPKHPGRSAAAGGEPAGSCPEGVGVEVCSRVAESDSKCCRTPTTLRFTSPGAALMTLTGCHGRSRDDAANDTGFSLHAVSAAAEERLRQHSQQNTRS